MMLSLKLRPREKIPISKLSGSRHSAFAVEGIGGGVLVSFAQGEGVNEGVNRLYRSIMQKPGIRLRELSNKLHVPVKTLERWIKYLRNEKKIIFKGAARTGGYHVTDGDA